MECGISGVILAGGSGKRFGGISKSGIIIDGETIYSRIISTIKTFFGEIIIVTNNPLEFNEISKYKIVRDVFSNQGPLGGIHAALKSSKGKAIFVFAGDMPFLNKRIIARQIRIFKEGFNDILVPRIENYIEPLHAIYKVSILNNLENYLKGDGSRAVRDFLNNMNTGYMRLYNTQSNIRAFTNINFPEDIP
jgi:molybdopterin-guanine dinucleotide biosynthesis protein A